MRRLICLISILVLSCASAYTQQPANLQLKEALVQGRIPKRLRTHSPFWGVPVPLSGKEENSDKAQASGNTETPEDMETYVLFRKDTLSIPRWINWNLDLASFGADRFLPYKSSLPKGYVPSCDGNIRAAINECYKWAWRKPYGNTNITMGPLFIGTADKPYAWFVAVCKKENIGRLCPLGFSSIAFLIPESSGSSQTIYNLGCSVNIIELHSGYNLFPKLPASVQEMVENMTACELFCPFQEIEDDVIENLTVEFDSDAPETDSGTVFD